MSVVREQARRRWALVGAGVAALCLAPVAISAWPAPGARADPDDLRARILASASLPYQGYVDSSGRLGLPTLPALDEISGLLSGSSRIRAWYASPTAWRVAQLDRTGERDTYQTATGTFVWDFERNQITQIIGVLPVRLPWAADIPPPELARRLLRGADPRDTVTAIPARRVAGILAVGVRLTPSDPDTTVGRVDVWADPVTGLPVQVEVAGRVGAEPVFTCRFLELSQRTPAAGLLTPKVPAGAGHVVVTPADITDALNGALPGGLPAELAGRSLAVTSGPLPGVSGLGGYGTGFSTFAVLALPGRLGGRTLAAARDAGAAPVQIPGAQAYEMQASVLATLVVRTDGDRLRRRGWLLAGLVKPELLRQAAADLVASA